MSCLRACFQMNYIVFCAQGGPGGPAPHIPPGANIGQSVGNFKKNYRQASPAQRPAHGCLQHTCDLCCLCHSLMGFQLIVFSLSVHHLA